MSRYARTPCFAVAVLVSFILLAAAEPAQANDGALDACSKWTGQEAGLQYKCFDCIKLVGEGPNSHWVNICPEYDDDEGSNWSPFADQQKRRR